MGVDVALRVPRLAENPGFMGLGPQFHTQLLPQPVPDPYWVVRSQRLASELGLEDWLASDNALQVLAGNALLSGSRPLASVYSGHQFGVWAGQLGDGRALLLGELASGQEIQLKGSGLTPYSRMGDGRAVLRSSIREFLVSETMHALDIPTTRALAVVGSDLPVRRERMETAAIVTRTAPSFVRFGHFEYFSHRGQHKELRQLADFVIERHFPTCRQAENPAAALLEAVTRRTAALIAQWQAVGFMHGVMNTDNMSILGLTMDYGPYQFMDGFDPDHICNQSDHQGRYAFRNQPAIAWWNLCALGQALLPLIGDVPQAQAALQPYHASFADALAARMAAKLGFDRATPESQRLTDEVLALMARERTDYAIFWRRLSQHMAGAPAATVIDLFVDRPGCEAWLAAYHAQATRMGAAHNPAGMLASNPGIVLRNHLAELAIERAQDKNFKLLEQLLAVLEHPFDDHPGHADWAGFPPDWASQIRISCSS